MAPGAARPAAGASWRAIYDGPEHESLHAAESTEDGGALLRGTTAPAPGEPRDAWVARIDAEGTLAWQVAVGPASDEGPFWDAEPSGAACLVLGGDSIVRLDADGLVSWSSRLPEPPTRVAAMADGGCAVSRTADDRQSAWVAGLDGTGGLAWARRLVAPPAAESPGSVEITGLDACAPGGVAVLVLAYDPRASLRDARLDMLDATSGTRTRSVLVGRATRGVVAWMRHQPGNRLVVVADEAVGLTGRARRVRVIDPVATTALLFRADDAGFMGWEGIVDAWANASGVVTALASLTHDIGDEHSFRQGRAPDGSVTWSTTWFRGDLRPDGRFMDVGGDATGSFVEVRDDQGVTDAPCSNAPGAGPWDAPGQVVTLAWTAMPDLPEVAMSAMPAVVTLRPTRARRFGPCGRVAEPSALDRTPGAVPLRVARDAAGARLAIGWEDVGAPAYELHRGTLSALRDGRWDHASLACDLPVPGATVADDAGSWYFLAAARDAWGPSSAGRDSFGRERPEPDGCP